MAAGNEGQGGGVSLWVVGRGGRWSEEAELGEVVYDLCQESVRVLRWLLRGYPGTTPWHVSTMGLKTTPWAPAPLVGISCVGSHDAVSALREG